MHGCRRRAVSMKRALIIGGNRFFGQRLAERLKAAGCHLTLVNRHGTGVADRIIRADRKDVSVIAPQLGDDTFDAVYDLAAYLPQDCKPALELFGKRTARFVVVSSIAVYHLGKDLTETDFDARSYVVPEPALSYMEGKRAVEAVFTREAPFPLVAVRFPFIVGEGDYSKRLEFHVDANLAGRGVFFCNPAAAVNFVLADEAAAFVHQIAEKTDFTGPINYASAEALTHESFMDVIASVTNVAPVYATKQSATNSSPYDRTSDKTMTLAAARALGFEPSSVHAWLPELVRSAVASSGALSGRGSSAS
jgi:nucleoside-diphosphate-sugar epimerase